MDRPSALNTFQLIQSIRKGDVNFVEECLHTGTDVQRTFLGLTPLHHAARRASVGMASILRRAGADINAKDEIMGETPLHHAIRYHQLLMVAWLLRNGAKVFASSRSPLNLAF